MSEGLTIERVDWNPGPALRLAEQLERRATERAAAAVLERAQQLVPYDTGNLSDSGHVVATADGAQVRFDAPYAVFVRAHGVALDGRDAHWLEDAAQEVDVQEVYADTFRSGWPGG